MGVHTYVFCIFLIISGAVQLETQRAWLKVPIYFKLNIILNQYKNNITNTYTQNLKVEIPNNPTNKTNWRAQY